VTAAAEWMLFETAVGVYSTIYWHLLNAFLKQWIAGDTLKSASDL